MRYCDLFGREPEPPGTYGRYAASASPDKKHKVVFEPGMEVRMMCMEHEFLMVDAKNKIIQTFRGLAADLQKAWWSPDSKIAAVSVIEGLLLYDIKKKMYSTVHFNSFQNDLELGPRSYRESMNRKEFEAWFGKEFQPPNDVVVPYSKLTWLPPPEGKKWDLRSSLKKAPPLKWDPPPSKELLAYAKKNRITLNF